MPDETSAAWAELRNSSMFFQSAPLIQLHQSQLSPDLAVFALILRTEKEKEKGGQTCLIEGIEFFTLTHTDKQLQRTVSVMSLVQHCPLPELCLAPGYLSSAQDLYTTSEILKVK